MEKQYSNIFKCCATCKKWQGKRKSFGTVVRVEHCIKGQCKGGGFNFAQVQENNCCNKWEKL